MTDQKISSKKENPWTTLTNKDVYDNPWITVSHREVITPADEPGIYGVIHFKNIAIGVIPLDEENNTWIVGQYRYFLEEYSWEIPEGGGLLGIDPIESAAKELKEETGIIANQYEEILKIHTSNSVTDEYGLVYVARDLTYGEATPEPCEKLIVKKLPFEEVYHMVMRGEITDSLSIAGIMKVKLMYFS